MIAIGFSDSRYCVSSCSGYLFDSKCFNDCPEGTKASGSTCITCFPSCSRMIDLIKGITLIEANNSMIEFDYDSH